MRFDPVSDSPGVGLRGEMARRETLRGDGSGRARYTKNHGRRTRILSEGFALMGGLTRRVESKGGQG